MHDQFNTRNGNIGFVVTLADGTVLREDQVTWDEVPTNQPLRKLAIVHLPSGHEYIALANFQRVLFSNVARAGKTTQESVHVGKLVGGVNGDKAVTVVLDFSVGQIPTVDKREMPTADLPYTPTTFRDMAT
jgi:hypothetical protein